MAQENRTDDPELAQILHDISREEMGHFDKLHAQAVKWVNKIKEAQDAFGA